MDGNSSAHAAAAVFNVYFLNSLKESSSHTKAKQTIIPRTYVQPVRPKSDQSDWLHLIGRLCWLVYQIISELYNSTGNFITPARFWVDQKNVGYWSGLVDPKLGVGSHCDNHNRLKLCDDKKMWHLLGRPLAVAARDMNCPTHLKECLRSKTSSQPIVLLAYFGALALVAKNELETLQD